MPWSIPAPPTKPLHLQGTFATPPTGKSYGKYGKRAKNGVKAPIPPRVRTQIDEESKEQSGDNARREPVEQQTQEDDAKSSADEKRRERNTGPRPEQSPMQRGPPGPPLDFERPSRKRTRPHPQRSISKLWKNFDPEYLGRVTRILPDTPGFVPRKSNAHQSQNAAESYRAARTACEETVRKIIEECTALNHKYTDVHFDLERDLKITRKRDCLDGLAQSDDEEIDNPTDVKRVTDLFDNPRFFSDGAGFDDIIQGAIGDCWLMSAFSVLSCSEELIRRVCVVQDQDVGVYGFVFYRDGEWHPTIIDDKLYLRALAFDESINTMLSAWGKEQESKYTELFQRGSKALYFASCRDDNETWVPLLEKALAKAHGGYDALKGGQTGEAIEDLTGGVTTEVYTTNILSKERFWKDELRRIGKDFMFDATDAAYREWQRYDENEMWVKQIRSKHRKGVQARHAYAVLDTYEGYGERLIKVRNPWGESEWDGAWSDGSPQWTAEWLERLDHKFGDDGVFWMNYRDFLRNYKHINRTRIFDESWYTAQKWAEVQVPFSTIDYQQTKFQIDIPEDTDTVIALSQLDTRYFQGLEGKYHFQLHFRISKADNENEYIARSRPNYELERSTNLELNLKKGLYTILIKVEATDWSIWGSKSPEHVIKQNLPHRKEKVLTIGRLYDLAHQKGRREPEDSDEEADDNKSVKVDEAREDKRNVDDKEADKQARLDAALAAVSRTTANGIVPTAMRSPTPPPPSLPPRSVSSSSDSYSDVYSDSDTSSDAGEEKIAPWNASCVVGLRVYSKHPDCSVKVIWPSTEKVKKSETALPQLDRDAITKAPQDEAEKNASPVERRSVEDRNGKDVKESPSPIGVMERQPDGGVVLAERTKNEEDTAHENPVEADGKE